MSIKFLAVVLVALLVGVVAGYYVGYDIGFERGIAGSSPRADGTASGFRMGKNAVYVAEQPPGDTVRVGFADIAQGGYVVILEHVNGEPGAVLGASSFLPAGGSENFTVALSRRTRDGEELVAMLHADNGDGVFVFADDPPVKDEARNVMFMVFIVSVDALAPDAVSL